jgi:hypothetical protein
VVIDNLDDATLRPSWQVHGAHANILDVIRVHELRLSFGVVEFTSDPELP